MSKRAQTPSPGLRLVSSNGRTPGVWIRVTHIPPFTTTDWLRPSIPPDDRLQEPSVNTAFRPLKHGLQNRVTEGRENSCADREEERERERLTHGHMTAEEQ